MAQTVFGAEYAVSVLNRAFSNTSPGNSVFNNQVKTAGDTEATQYAFAAQFAKSFANTSDAALARQVLENMGVQAKGLAEVQPLEAALAEYFGTVSKEDRGIVVLQLGEILSGLETATGDQAEYAPAAKAWNTEIEQAFIYSSNPANTASVTGDPDPTPPNQGQTFTLTTGTDALTGGAGDDTFIAGVVKSNDGTTDLATLTAGDSINGGSGTDSIQLIGNGNATAFASANVTNVEKALATFTADGGALNVSGNSGVKEAWVSNATLTDAAGDATVTLTKAQTGGIKGNVVNDNNTNGATTAVTFAFTSVAGTSDAATIALDNAKLVKNAANKTGVLEVVAAGIETLTLAATGTNTIGLLTAVDAAKLIVTGDGKLTATLSDTAAYKTIDASANTGGVSINAAAVNAANQVLDIKGGSGDDTYTTLFAQLTKDDKIDLGGGVDTLAFGDATALNTAANVAKLAGAANVEVIGVGGNANLTVDAELVAQSAFAVAGTGAFAGSNMSATDKLIVSGAQIAASTIGMKTGQTTTNIDLKGSATAAADASNGITVTGASTINVASSGTATVAVNKLALTTDANGTVNLTGAKDLILTTATAAATAGLSLQAGSFTGRLDVTGSAQSDIIVGGSGADIIRGSLGGDTITLGAGKDVVSYANAGQTLGDVGSAAGIANSIDKITDWNSADDKIAFGGAVIDFKTLTASQQTDVTGAADLKVALELAEGFIGAGKTAAFTYGGNTYVFHNVGAGLTAGADFVVELTGTHTLTADNLTGTAAPALV